MTADRLGALGRRMCLYANAAWRLGGRALRDEEARIDVMPDAEVAAELRERILHGDHHEGRDPGDECDGHLIELKQLIKMMPSTKGP